MVIGKHAVVGAMRHRVRWTEELLIATLFRFHPSLANGGLLYDGSEEQRNTYTLEGGDVHPAAARPLGRGLQRALLPAALDQLCELVFASTTVTDVIVVVMPKEPTAIHLDMLFTQVDHELCVVYPPYFVGPERRAVLHRRKGEEAVHEMPDFFAAVRAVGLPLQPVFAGGARRISQERSNGPRAASWWRFVPVSW
jgi:arginine deiminase